MLSFLSQQALTDECYFLEKYEENNYNTYRSQKYGWYVALKKNGQPKAGPDTHQGQKAIFFLPRSAGSIWTTTETEPSTNYGFDSKNILFSIEILGNKLLYR